LHSTHSLSFFFFQAEDGIRDKLVTGVQTCALPISSSRRARRRSSPPREARSSSARRPCARSSRGTRARSRCSRPSPPRRLLPRRSEEHTSELQSLAYLVCRLLLEKKKAEYNSHGHV